MLFGIIKLSSVVIRRLKELLMEYSSTEMKCHNNKENEAVGIH